MVKKNYSVILFFLVLIGILLRFYNIGAYGIWGDEEFSILSANGQLPISDTTINIVSSNDLTQNNTFNNVIESNLILDSGNSIAYNITLHYWLNFFGNSETSARMFSLLFSVLTIILIYFVSDYLFKDKKIAIIIAFLITIHPLSIAYSQEARAYSMATFFSLLSTYFFLKIIRLDASIKTFLLYILFTFISLLSHYLTISVFLAHGLIFLFKVKEKKYWINYILSSLFICVLFYVWMLIGGFEGLKYMNIRNANYTMLAENFKIGDNPYFMPATVKNIITGWLQVWLQTFGNGLQEYGLRIRDVFVLLLLPFYLLFITIKHKKELITKYNNIFIVLLFLIFTHTIFSTFLALKSKHCISFQPSYAIFTIPYAMIFLGFAMFVAYQQKNKIINVITSLCIVFLMFASSIPTYQNLQKRFPNENKYSKIANEINTKNDTLHVNSIIEAQLISLYVKNNQTVFFRIKN